MSKKFLSVIFIVFILILNANLALAQTTNIEIINLETQIMPEYDTADILIVNSIKLSNKSKEDFTGELKWRVPKGSTKQIVTETVNANNHLKITVIPNNAYDEILWKLPNPLKAGEMKEIHLEFYYNNLQGNPDKEFTYDFIPAYPVITAQMLLLQPTKAANLKITPEFGQPMSNQGWTYYMKKFSNLAKDQVINVKVNYTKTDPNPSVVPGQQPGQTQSNQNAVAANSNDKIWIFAAAAIAIVIVIAVAYLKTQRNNFDEDEDEQENEDQVNYVDDEEGEDIKKDPSKSKMLAMKKKELRNKLEEGLITDVDYYEAVMELEEEARE